MIKIEGYDSKQKENIEFDLYVPINIEFETYGNINHKNIYWRTGNLKDSMLEVGIENNTIKTITLVICKKVYKNNFISNLLKSEEGFPKIKLEQKKEKIYYDDPCALNTYIADDCIYILFSDMKIIYGVVNGRVTFLMDENRNWSGIKISGVSSKERELFIKSLE